MREYASYLNASVGGEHICVESLEAELAALPGGYAEPDGTILLAFLEGDFPEDHPAGCVALKPLHFDSPRMAGPASSENRRDLDAPASQEERACEMKRLWVRPSQQRTGLGRKLADAVLEAARQHGYTAMYLDTMPGSMQAAYALYRSMGFEPVERYNHNPVLRQVESLEIAFLRKELR